MGEVYRAEDTKLGREVAIKLLPEAVANDPERLARFEREAKVLASLNHPNIAAIYSLESATAGAEAGRYEEGVAVDFLVMELVEGEDLQERIHRGPIPQEEAMRIALQVAEALEAAHERGVVHRDLKPANVKLTPDQKVKVLDFGLAKALDPMQEGRSGSGNLLSMSPTLTAQMTQAGIILGTASYMAPEQARGEEVDKRADIWAFGVLLYEMLTGQKSFDGKTVTDVIAAVVTRDPDWTALPLASPEPLKRLMVRCTRKEPHERLHDIADARLELAEGIANPEAWQAMAIEGATPRAGGSKIGWLVAAAMTLVAAGILAWALTAPAETSAVADPVWFHFNDPPAMVAPLPNSIAVSRDGRRIAYTALAETEFGPGFEIYLRSLGSLQPQAVPGSGIGLSPFFSPDGQRVGFFSLLDGKLKIVELQGGAVTPLVDIRFPRGAVWRDDDVIFYGPDTEAGIWRINSDGTDNVQVTFPSAEGGERSHRYPDLLPDGRTILFTVATTEILTFDEARIDAMNLETGERTTLIEKGSFGRFVEPGYLLYAREGSIMAVPFDPETLETSGRQVMVVDGVVTSPQTGGADFAVGAGGTLAYFSGEEVKDPRQLVWVNREGNSELVIEDELPYQSANCSPDGRSLILDIDAANANVWLLELDRHTMVRLTPSRSNNQPIWAPDGQRVAFSSSGEDGRKPYLQGIDGSAPTETIPAPDGFWWPRSFNPAGTDLVASLEVDQQSSLDIWILPVSGEKEARPLIATRHREDFGRVSPDGNWIAYQSDESGNPEIYVQRYPDLGEKIRISRDGGHAPVWSHDGTELYFSAGLSPANVGMMFVPVEMGPPLRVGAPQLLFETDMFPFYFDVCPDGRFVVIKKKQEMHPVDGVNVALDWTQTLPQLVPK